MSKSSRNVIGALVVLYLLTRYSKAGATTVSANLKDYSFKGASFPAGLARGMKINNPGNLRDFNQPWQGRVVPSSDSAFYEFESYAYGLRAMIKLLKNYISQGDNTIKKILYRYAPPHENKTDEYISYVERESGYNRNRVLQGRKDELQRIIKPMVRIEQGVDGQIERFFNTAYSML